MIKNIKSAPNYSAVRNDETIRKGKHYLLFDPSLRSGFTQKSFQPSFMGAELLKGKKDIFVWDPHFTENRDHEFFRYVDTEDVYIEILTYREGPIEDCELAAETLYDKICNLLESKIETFTLKIHLIHYENDRELRQNGIILWHDRYLMADDDVYLLGTSLTSQLNGNRLYGIHKIQEEADRVLIIKSYEKYRNFSNNKDFGLIIPEDKS